MNDNAFLLALAVLTLVLIVLCSGEPDIIDGWAKMANDVACEKVENQ